MRFYSHGFFSSLIESLNGLAILLASLALQLRICLQTGLCGGGLMRPSPERPGDNVGRLDARLREPYGYAADFLNGPADKGRIGGIFNRRLGWAGTLLARCRIVAIMTSETWRCHPCQERVSL